MSLKNFSEKKNKKSSGARKYFEKSLISKFIPNFLIQVYKQLKQWQNRKNAPPALFICYPSLKI